MGTDTEAEPRGKTRAASDRGESFHLLLRVTALASALLLVLLLGVGLVSAWYLAKIDKDYTRLIDESTRNLRIVQAITARSGLIFGSMMDLIFSHGRAEQTAIRQMIATERAANDKLYAELDASINDPEVQKALDASVAARKAFYDTYAALLALIEKGDAGAAAEIRSKLIMPAFLAHQAAREELCAQIERWTHRLNDETNDHVLVLRRSIMGLAILPAGVAVLLAGLLVFLLYLISGTSQEEDLHREPA